MSSRRQQQMAEFLRVEISEIIHRELKDPRLGIVSVTQVDVSPDMRYAKVHISELGTAEEREEAVKALGGAAGFVRHLLKPRMRTRHIPEISFKLDSSMEYAETMARVLNELDLEASDGTPPSTDEQDKDRVVEPE